MMRVRGRRRVVAGMAVLLVIAAAVPRLRGADRGPIVRLAALDQQPIGALVNGRSGRVFVLTADATTGAFRGGDVAPHGNGQVRVFDTAGGTPLHTEAAGYLPCAIVTDERAGRVLVAYSDPDTIGGAVLTLDAASGALLHATPTDAAPCGGTPVVDQHSARAFFAGADNSLSTFDTGTGRLLRTVHAYANGGVSMAVDERDSRVFAVFANSGIVGVFDTRDGRRLRAIAFGVTHPLLTPIVDAAGRLLVVDQAAGTVSVVDARGLAVRAVTLVAREPAAWALDPATPRGSSGGRLLVGGDTALSVVDTRSGAVVRTLALGVRARQILVDTRRRRAFLLVSDHLGPSGHIPVVDTRTGRLVTTIILQGVAMSAALDARHDRLVVAQQDGTVDILDAGSGRLIHAWDTAPGAPSGLTLDANTGRAFVLHGRGFRLVPDRWTWIPSWMRARLPFVPRPGLSYQDVPAGITIVDDTR